MSILQQGQKNWNDPKKKEARKATIIEVARNLFKWKHIPKNRQYWSLCGECGCDSGLKQGTELDQLLQQKFLTIDQFYGVELNSDIHNMNTKIVDAHWFNKDIRDAIDSQMRKKNFNPAIINVDTTNIPHNAVTLLTDIMYSVNVMDIHDIIIVFNVVIKTHGKQIDAFDIIKEMENNSRFASKYTEGNWQFPIKEFYVYSGTGGSCTDMCSMILMRN